MFRPTSLVFVLAAPVWAQSFVSVDESPFLAKQQLVRAVVADFDGDGDTDVFGCPFWPFNAGPLVFYRNRGEGWFVAETPWFLVASTATANMGNLEAVDLDGDGDQDVVVAVGRSSPCGLPDRWLRNDGTGSFSLQTILPVDDNTVRLVPFNYDSDPEVELLQVNFHGGFFCSPLSTRVIHNSGAGWFADTTSGVMPGAPYQRQNAVVLDVQGDGRLDVVFDDGAIFLNNGVQVLQSTLVVPALAAMAVSDLDGDSDLDIFGIAGGAVQIVRNDGGGVLTLVAGPMLPAGVDGVSAGDIDGDGDRDLFLHNRSFQAVAPQLWRHDPGFAFVDLTATHLPTIAMGSPVATFFDSDGDGDLDLLTSAGILHNVGGGRFAVYQAPPSVGPGRTLDVDGDGNVDILGAVTTGTGGSIGWWRNELDGRFAFVATLVTGDIGIEPGIVLFDMEGDGDQDVFVCRNREILLRNDGGGVFTDVTTSALPAPPAPPASRSVKRVVANDFDADGDIDLFLARGAQWPASPVDSFYRNNGSGTFVDVGQAYVPDTGVTDEVAGLDHDGDGDLDLALVNVGVPQLWRNDGTAHFTNVTAGTLPAITGASDLIVADVDGDQDADLVVGRQANGTILLRNGNGVFVQSPGLNPAAFGIDPVATDFDLDGDVDLSLDGYWYVNDGTGSFALSAQPRILSSWPKEPNRFADADGDGDPDLVWSLANHHRQLQNVVPPRLGLHGELWLHARSDTAGWSSLGMLLLGAVGAAPVPIPGFGELRLDLASVALHSVSVIPANGPGLVRYLCPNQPVLLGVVLGAQPFFLHGPMPSSWHLGNTVLLRVNW